MMRARSPNRGNLLSAFLFWVLTKKKIYTELAAVMGSLDKGIMLFEMTVHE